LKLAIDITPSPAEGLCVVYWWSGNLGHSRQLRPRHTQSRVVLVANT
jgi:hypothetical protein